MANRHERRKQRALERKGQRPIGMLDGVVHESVMMRSLKRAVHSIDEGPLGNPDVMAPTACPHCGVICEAASHADRAHPRPNDTSVCLICAGASRFDANLGLKGLSDADVEALPARLRSAVQEGQALVRAALQPRKGPVAEA